MRRFTSLICTILIFILTLPCTPAFADGDHITILNMDNTSRRFKETERLFHLRYPDVEVIVKTVTDPRVVNTGMMSKNGDVDLLMTYEMFNPVPTYQYYASGAIEDLSQYPEITQYLPEYVDRFAACMVDGHLFAIPEMVYLQPFRVNDVLAEKMEINIPTGEWTWEDFRAIGEQVAAYNEANETKYYLFHDSLWAPYILNQATQNAIDCMAGKSHFSEEQYQRAFEAWLWVLDHDLVMDSQIFSDPMGKALFVSEYGLLYGHMGTIHYILPPVFSETTRFTMSNSAIMMNANSQHKEEAVYFLSCFFSPEAVGKEPIETIGPWFIDESRHFSVRELWGWGPEPSPENKEMWSVLIQRSLMNSLIGSIWKDLLNELYPALLDGQLTIPQFLQQAEHRANLMLGE